MEHKKVQIRLRAPSAKDLPRLKLLWNTGFPQSAGADYFFETCFAPDHVETGLVLLENDVVQSAVYFLPTFWYDGKSDSYTPAPCLVGLSTADDRRHQKYASWLVETACDFMVEKGAGGVWTVLPNDTLELFFSMQGFWTLPGNAAFSMTQANLPAPTGTIQRAEPEMYDRTRELLLKGQNHIVAGPLLSQVQRDMAERCGGGMFLLNVAGETICIIAQREGEAVKVRELLCPEELRAEALALLVQELPAARYEMDANCPMLRMMNQYNKKLEQPSGILGCGSLL